MYKDAWGEIEEFIADENVKEFSRRKGVHLHHLRSLIEIILSCADDWEVQRLCGLRFRNYLWSLGRAGPCACLFEFRDYAALLDTEALHLDQTLPAQDYSVPEAEVLRHILHVRYLARCLRDELWHITTLVFASSVDEE